MKRNLLTVILLIISTLGAMEYAVGQTLPKASILRQVGCGTGANAGKAEVIVTVDQDNTSNYTYNFGNGYSSSNRAWLDPGTRTIAVRRNDNKQYNVTINVPNRTATPTITPAITYNCNGTTADVRLINDQGTYNYTYVYNGQPQSNPYFRNLTVGQQHTITVKYTPAPSAVNKTIVFYDDFGVKDANSPQKSVSSPYVNKGVYFDPLDGTGIQTRPIDNATRSYNLTVDSSYAIATTADISFLNSAYWWYVCNDKDGNPNGRFLWYNANITDAENATFKKNVAYKRQATIQPGKPVQFTAYVYNPVKNSGVSQDQRVRAQLQIFRTEADAMNNTNPIYTNDSYSYAHWLPKNNSTGNDWMALEVTANTLPSDTALWFVVRFDAPGASGNDIAIDNISVTQPADTCENSIDVAVNVASNTNTFSTTISYATCNATTGIITVNASDTTNYDYTYSLDGQAAQTNKVFNGVAVGVHTITIKATPKGAKTLFKEDFGSGAPYRLPTSVVPANFVCRDQMIAYPADILPEGHYQVANQSNLTPFMGWNWRNPKDHTDSSNPQGRYLAFNYGANANKVFYQQDIKVERNKLITVEFYIYNLNKSTGTSGYPKIDVRFEDLDIHNDIHSFSFVPTTGNVNDTDWRKCTFTFTSAVGDKLRMKFINLEGSEGSNDFAIDDILVTQAYEACTTTLTTTVTAQITRAFAGVTKLIGCGTGLNANKAEVQVTNIEGGNGNYEFRFGDGGSWVTTNTGWLDAGTHTVSVRNAGSIGCVYSMSVTVPTALAAPVIKTEVFYGCDGKPTLQVGVQSPVNELTYLYKLDNGAFTTTYIFTDISTGTHEVSVKFDRRQIASPYILMKEDFGKGEPMALPGIVPSTWQHQPANTGTQALDCLQEGKYTVAPQNKVITCAGWCWTIPRDHTSNGTDATGRYYAMNIGGALAGQRFYYRDVDNVKPNRPVKYEMYLVNLLDPTCPFLPGSEANIQIRIIDKVTSAVLDTKTTGALPRAANNFAWQKYEGTLNPGNATSIRIEFRDLETGSAGNDFAIDDITVYQDPDTCGQVVSSTLNITDKPAAVSFTAAQLDCGVANGTIVVTASPTTGYIYTYTLQGGTATSVNTFRNLSFGTHTFTINYAPVTNTLVLLNEDFGEGTDAVKSYYAAKNLYFNTNKSGAYTAYNGNGQGLAHNNAGGLQEYEYTIAHQLIDNNGNWNVPNDHSGKVNGRKLFVNPTTMTQQDLYLRQVSVLPNTSLKFSAQFFNLLKYAGWEPIVQLAIYDKEGGNLISQTPPYAVPHSTTGNDWREQVLTLTDSQVGARNTLYVVVRMLNTVPGGHDMAMDDIRITQSIGCEATVTATVQSGVTRAFAGVTKLIGCGTGLNANKAEVQVTNIEGGAAPYEYQFGTGASWVASNTGWLDAGTHTVSVRNAGSIGCVYSMSVNVPAALAAPVIKTEVFYGCDGKPTLQVGVQSPVNELTYLYKLDNGAFTTTSVFANVSSDTHQVSVKYEYRDTPSPMVLWREDFGTGDPAPNSSVNATDFTYKDPRVDNLWAVGRYTVAGYKDLIAPTPFGTSRMPFYHPTTAPNAIFREPPKGTTTGAPDDRILYVDMASAYVGKVFMEKEVDIHPTNLIAFSYQIQNANGPNRGLKEPNMQIKIVDANNASNVLGTINSGAIANDGAWHLVSSRDLGAINPNGVTRVKIQFINVEPNSWGNDFYLDDITVYQTPAACGQVVSSTLNVIDNSVGVATFTAAQLGCGGTNGTVVVTASPTTGYIYTYTLQGGGTATSVNTFANLSFGTHTFTINYAPVTNTLVLLNEDFGEGTDAVKSPYVGKNLYFNENTLSAYTAYNGNKQSMNHPANTYLMEGEYTIASNMVRLSGDWTVPTDRSGKANGRKLFIDGIVSVPEQEIYTREVSIAPNLPLTFTTDFYNLVHNASVPSVNNPRVNIALYESEASYKNGSVPLAQSAIEELLSVGNQWKTHTLTLTAGDVGTRTRIYAVVKMHNVINSGHDLTIDNIRITQSIGCEATVTATVLPGVTRAFAGVTQLIGCGTEENADKAQVRVSNVEGGTAPYEYQFGVGEAWVTTNTMWLEAGTYTVSVRSNGGLGCVFSTKVVVPEKLGTPTVTTQVQYDCEGKGILTVGIENPDPALRYWFSLNGEAYTTTYIFTGLTSGTQYLSVKYDYITPPQSVLLFKDDFGNGAPTALPGPASDYNLTYGTAYPITSGHYQIVSQADAPSYWAILTPFGSCAMGNPAGIDKRWVSVYDHTSGGTDPTGRFYMSDFRGTQADGDLFYKREVSVLPGSDINYEFYALNLFRNDNTTSPWGHGEALKPNVVVRLVAPNGTVVTSTTTGEMPYSVCATNVEANLNNWRKYEGKLNVGTYTKLTVEIRSVGSASHAWGNDMAMDDITVLMTPKSCGQYYNVDTDVIATDRVVPQFTVSRTIDCATGKGGFVVTPTLTTGYTYTYTLNSTTVTGTIATFTGLSFSDTTHTITVQYQSVSKTVTVLKEDFGTGTGAVKNAYVGKDLYFNNNTTGAYTAYNGRGQSRAHVAGAVLAVDEYTVVNALSLHTPDWRSPSDKSGDANGRKLYVDGSASAIKQDIYTRKLSVRPNTALTFTADFYNLVQADLVLPANNTAANYPQVQLQLYESETAYNAPGATPIHSDNIYAVTPATSLNDWRTRSITLTDTQVGGRTELYAVVRMHNVINAGHDLVVDNIIVTQELPACVVTLTATLTNEGLRTPTLSVPADIDILCVSATATTAVANWIAQATATDTNCDVVATVTATYTYTGSLCNAGSVTVTFTATGTFGNITTKTAVINFIKTPLVVTPTLLQIPDNIAGGTTSSVIPNITLGGVTSPSVNSVTITFSGLPSGVTSTTGGRLVVAPNTPAGVHSISYRVCEVANSNNCKTVTSTLIIGAATPTVGANTFTATTNTRTVIPGVIGNILTGATVGTRTATAGVGGNVSITLTHTPTTPNAPQIDPATGSVTVSSNTPAGVYTIGYQLCSSPIHCQAAVATITVPQIKPYIPAATITHSGTATTTRSIFVGGHVNGGTQSPTVGTGGSVSIGNIVNPTPATPGASVPTLAPNTGVITIPPTTPNGVYTISYQVCTTATPTSCVTGTTTITVANVTPTVTADSFTATTTTGNVVPGVIGNILTNDNIGGASATTNLVTIRVTHTPTTPNAPVLNPATGSVTVSGNTPSGIYTIGYQVCSGSSCASGTLTVTVPQLQPNVPNTTITHNGTTTTTGNVLAGGTVNGGSQSATVTGANPTVQITVTSSPTGSVVPRLDPSTGIVTVPPTTPNGVYTISYNICTTATPTSCVSRTTTIVVGNVTPTVTADSFTATTTTGNVVPGVIGNILTNDNIGGASATTNLVTIRVTHTPTTPNAPVLNPATGSVTVSGNTPAGVYTIGYEVCNGAKCATGTVTVTVPQLLPNVPTVSITHSGTATTTRNVLDGATVNGGSQSATVTGSNPTVQITVTSSPTGSVVPRLDPSTGIVTVPPTTPNGVYTISYNICTTATPTSCVSRTTTIIVGNVTPTVTPDDVTASVTTSGVVSGTIGNILTNDNIGGASATTNLVTISVTHTPTTPNAPVLNPATGSVTVSSNTPAGVYTIGYEVCNGAKCATGTVTVTVPQLLPNVPTVSITHSGTATTTRNILDGATVNGGSQSATVTGSNPTVQITVTSSPTGSVVPRLDPSTGIVTVPPTTPNGVYTISYSVCTTATPTSCVSRTTVITVGNSSATTTTPTVTPDDVTASVTTNSVVPGTIGNILTNDRVGTGSATAGTGGNVTIRVTHTPTTPNAPVLNPATGSVTVSGNTPAGVYTIGYEVCNGAKCATGTVTVTVPQLLPNVPNVSITHSGTATTTRNVLDGGTVNGGSQSATVTGSNPTVQITVTSTPTGSVVPRLDPSTGIVTVPPTTPNGVYTISYSICTTATPTSCVSRTTVITVGNSSATTTTPTVTPDDVTASVTTSGVVPGTIGNILTNDRVGTGSATAGTGGNVTIRVTHTPTTPNAPVLHPATGSVTVSGNTPAGVYTISYEVCNGANCATGTVTVTVPQLLPNVPTVSITHSGTATTTRNVLDGATVNGGSQSATVTGSNPTVQITVTSSPTGSVVPRLDPSTGIVTVPPTTPNGVYTISYNICTTATPTSCVSRTTTIIVGSVTPTVTPDDVTASVTTNSVVPGTIGNILTNDTIGGASVTTNEVTIRVTHTPTTPNAPVLHPATGSVTVSGNTPAGVYTIGYEVCNGAKCATGTVTVTVPQLLPNVPTVSITHSGTATTTRNVLDGGTVNGGSQSATVTGSNPTVQITVTSSPTGSVVPRLDPSTGIVTVPPTTPNGVYTISYNICTTATPTSCVSRTTVITVGNSSATTTTPTIVITPDSFVVSSTSTRTTPSVFDNDRIVDANGNTHSVTSSTVTISTQTVTTNASGNTVTPTINPDGTITIPEGLRPGNYTITYQLCTTTTPTTCANGTVTFTVVPTQPTVIVNPDSFVVTGTGTRTTPSVFDNDHILHPNGSTTAVNSSTVTISTQSVTTNASGNTVTPTINPDGTITIPEGLRPGNYTITYQLCTTTTPTTCANGTVTFTVVPTQPTVIVNPDSFVVTGTGTRTTPSVFDNDHILHPNGSTTAVNSSTVTISTQSVTTNASGNTVTPTINPDGTITIPEGLRPGNYTITYQLCTTASPSTCTTGEVNFEVPDNEVPDAHTITATTFINTPVEIKVTDKPATHVNVITPPANGIATNNGDGTITYEPNNGFVGTDEFEYTLCTAGGCSTATVRITVTADLIIYNGVSLNGSALNNHFHIGGIEAYPNNTVRIYNRWGAEVFSAEGYDNLTKVFNGRSNARATMDAGDHLPQGTYYYIIEYYDAANERHKEVGWLYLKK